MTKTKPKVELPPAPSSDLDKKFYMLSVRRSQYRGIHTLPNLQITVDGQNVPKQAVSKGRVNLIPDKWHDKFQAEFGKVAKILDVYTAALRMTEQTEDEADPLQAGPSILNMRVLPVRASTDVFKELRQIQGAVNRLAAELYAAWEYDVVQYNKDIWEPLLGEQDCKIKILGRLPEKKNITNRFRVSWGIFKIGEASIGSVTDSTMRAEIEAARASARTEINTAMASMLEEPRRLLAASLDNMVKKLTDAKFVKDATFNEVRDAIRRVEAFADIGDKELLQKAAKLRTEVEHVVETGRAGQDRGVGFSASIAPYAKQLATVANALKDHCLDTAAMQVVRDSMGLEARSLDLD